MEVYCIIMVVMVVFSALLWWFAALLFLLLTGWMTKQVLHSLVWADELSLQDIEGFFSLSENLWCGKWKSCASEVMPSIGQQDHLRGWKSDIALLCWYRHCFRLVIVLVACLLLGLCWNAVVEDCIGRDWRRLRKELLPIDFHCRAWGFRRQSIFEWVRDGSQQWSWPGTSCQCCGGWCDFLWPCTCILVDSLVWGWRAR